MHDICSHTQTKTEKYRELLPQLGSLIAADADLPTAVLANVCAVLKAQFGWWWVGFYLVDEARGELQLAPFQGEIACTRIAKGRGVCGQAWVQNRTLVVPDVNRHPDHIACSTRSRSEIVVPLHGRGGQVVGVLDIDSEQLACFDETDAEYLQQLCKILSQQLFQAA